jgi:hypothetical protein
MLPGDLLVATTPQLSTPLSALLTGAPAPAS